MYDRELDQRLGAMHDQGVHCTGGVLRLSYDERFGHLRREPTIGADEIPASQAE